MQVGDYCDRHDTKEKRETAERIKSEMARLKREAKELSEGSAMKKRKQESESEEDKQEESKEEKRKEKENKRHSVIHIDDDDIRPSTQFNSVCGKCFQPFARTDDKFCGRCGALNT